MYRVGKARSAFWPGRNTGGGLPAVGVSVALQAPCLDQTVPVGIVYLKYSISDDAAVARAWCIVSWSVSKGETAVVRLLGSALDSSEFCGSGGWGKERRASDGERASGSHGKRK
jgi:hypothetical protein